MVLVISTLATLHSHHWHPLAWFWSSQLLLHSTVIVDTPWHGSGHLNSCYTPQSSLTPPGMVLVISTLATLHSHHWHPQAWFWSSQLLLPSTVIIDTPRHGSGHLNSCYTPQSSLTPLAWIWSSQLLLHSTVIIDTPWHGSGHLNSCYPPQSSLTPPGMVLVISTLATLHSHRWHPLAWFWSSQLLLPSTVIVDTLWHGSVHVNSCYTPQSSLTPPAWFWSSQLLLHSTVIGDTPWHGSGHLNSCYTPQSSLTPPGMVLFMSTLATLHSHHWHPLAWFCSCQLLLHSTVIIDTTWHGSGHLNSCYPPQSSLTPPGMVLVISTLATLHSHHWHPLAWFWSSQLLLHSTVITDIPWHGSGHLNSCYPPQSSMTPPGMVLVISTLATLHSHHWHLLAWFWSSQLLLHSTVITDIPWHGSGHLNSCYPPQSSLTPPGMVLVISTLATLHSHHWHPLAWFWSSQLLLPSTVITDTPRHGSGHLNSCYTPQSSLTPPGMVLVISTLATLHSHRWHPLAWFWSSQLLLHSTVIVDTPWHGSGHLNSCYTPQSSLTPPGMVLVISTLATLHSHHWHPLAWFWSSQLLLHSTVIIDTPWDGSGHLNSCYTPQSSLTPPGMVLVISTLATLHSHHWHPLAWFWSSQLLLHSTVITDTPWDGSGHLNSCYTPQSSLTPPGMVLVISTLATLHSHHWHPLAWFWSSQLLLPSTVITDIPWHGSGHLNSCYTPQSSLTPPGMVLVISTLATLHSHHWHPLAWFWSSQLLLHSTVITDTPRHGSGHLNSCYTPQSSLTPPGMVLVISTLATLHSHHWHPLGWFWSSQLLLHSTVIIDTPWHGSGHLNSCYTPQSSLTPPGMVLVISTLATLHSHRWHPLAWFCSCQLLLHSTVIIDTPGMVLVISTLATLHSHRWHPLAWFWSSQLLLHSTVIIDTPWHGSVHVNSCYTPQSSLTPPGMVLFMSTLATLHSHHWHHLAWFWSSQLLLPSTVIIDPPRHGSGHLNSCYPPQSSLTSPGMVLVISTLATLHSHHWHPLAWFWSSQLLLPSTVIIDTPRHGSGHLNSCYPPQSSLTSPGLVLVISTLATLHSHHWHPLAWFWSSQLLLPSTVITDTPRHGSGHLNSCYTPQSSLTPPEMVLVISTLATLHSHHWHPLAWFWSSQLLLPSTVITDIPWHGSGHLNSCYTPQSSLTPPGMVLVISTLATLHSHHWHPLGWFCSCQFLLHSTVITDTPWHGSGHLNSC